MGTFIEQKRLTCHLQFFQDLQTLTLVGHTLDNPVLDPLAVLHLYNRQCINENDIKKVIGVRNKIIKRWVCPAGT